MANKETTRLVKPYAKGQVTIPAEFREKLNIDENTILQMELKGSSIEITPLRVVDEDQLLREYDGSDIEAFLEEDKIDPGTASKVRDLLAG
ncbi:MAG: AbrB/MazE/SpoVT family DNA-binding domain-containing protein [Anaerolineales bacterium]|nr:AbrB/MazE/SpoVT family DNA-binding domain-containing protein [Anaerolineales bacterium]